MNSKISFTPLIKRLDENCLPIELNELQKQFIYNFNVKLNNRVYKKEHLACLCGSNDAILISQKDRYGFDLHTVLCKRCGLMRSDPYYDDETLIQFYNKEYRPIYVGKERCSADFFSDQENAGKIILNFVEEVIPPKKCLKVYEIGCGAGGILYTFKNNGHDVYGVDYGEEYLSYGVDKGLNIFKGSIGALQKHGKADLIILNHVLEHFKYPLKELKIINNLLSPNGILYVAVPGLDVIGEWYHYNILEYLQNAHAYHYNLTTLINTVSSAGFKLLKGNHFIQAVFYVSGGAYEKYEGNQAEYKRIIKTMRKFELLYNYSFILRLKRIIEIFILKITLVKNRVKKIVLTLIKWMRGYR